MTTVDRAPCTPPDHGQDDPPTFEELQHRLRALLDRRRAAADARIAAGVTESLAAADRDPVAVRARARLAGIVGDVAPCVILVPVAARCAEVASR
jgi:hypothetical protein